MYISVYMYCISNYLAEHTAALNVRLGSYFNHHQRHHLHRHHHPFSFWDLLINPFSEKKVLKKITGSCCGTLKSFRHFLVLLNDCCPVFVQPCRNATLKRFRAVSVMWDLCGICLKFCQSKRKPVRMHLSLRSRRTHSDVSFVTV